MISGITKEIGGVTHTFRMTTRAMMAIEQRFDKGLIDLMQGLNDGFRVSELVHLISECADDGRGIDVADAQELIDRLGVAGAGELLGKVSEAAFPEAKGQTKNAKGAARSK